MTRHILKNLRRLFVVAACFLPTWTATSYAQSPTCSPSSSYSASFETANDYGIASRSKIGSNNGEWSHTTTRRWTTIIENNVAFSGFCTDNGCESWTDDGTLLVFTDPGDLVSNDCDPNGGKPTYGDCTATCLSGEVTWHSWGTSTTKDGNDPSGLPLFVFHDSYGPFDLDPFFDFVMANPPYVWDWTVDVNTSENYTLSGVAVSEDQTATYWNSTTWSAEYSVATLEARVHKLAIDRAINKDWCVAIPNDTKKLGTTATGVNDYYFAYEACPRYRICITGTEPNGKYTLHWDVVFIWSDGKVTFDTRSCPVSAQSGNNGVWYWPSQDGQPMDETEWPGDEESLTVIYFNPTITLDQSVEN